FGTLYTFGAFFEAMAMEFDASLGATSIAFAITAFLFFGTGAASGVLADRWGARPLVWVGGFMFSVGLLATSRVDQLWHGYLTYGLGLGLGGGLFMTPLFAAAAAWFDRYRSFAQGVVATGSGIGTLVLVPVADRLIVAYGWRQAYVVLSVVTGVSFLIAGIFIGRPPAPPPQAAGRHLRKVLRSRSFRLLFSAAMCQSASIISAFAFIVPFATDAGVPSSTASWLVGTVGASSIVGRLALTGLAGRIGPVRMLQLSFAAQPAAFALWFVAEDSIPILVAFVVLLGVAYGGFVALMGGVTAHLFGVRGISSVMGFVYLGAGIGSLIYPPVVGFIADATTTTRGPIGAVLAVSALGTIIASRLGQKGNVISEVDRGDELLGRDRGLLGLRGDRQPLVQPTGDVS
ncbi:MAG: MFS transporter, partial [Actinomycetota bacterium]|nr:MFS transporter [Actinomycetota bacterium]